MKVKECMCTDVACVKPETTICDVAKLMLNKHVGCIPVCDNNKNVVGLVTDRDLTLRSLACEKDIKQTPVSEIMSCNVCCCETEDELYQAETKMAQNQIRRLPVTENGKVVGILTLGDLAKYNEEIGSEIIASTFEIFVTVRIILKMQNKVFDI